MSEYGKTTYAIVDKVYPLIAASMKKNSRKVESVMSDFLTVNHTKINDIAPYDNIYFGKKDIDNLFNALELTENDISDIMKDNCFYWNIAYNPNAAKEPYVIVVLMIIRYYLLQKNRMQAEIAAVYLAFSGKFYASIFSWDAFPKAPPSKYKTVMDYAINNMLTNKHDLKINGNMLGAVKSMCQTWLDAYEKVFTGRSSDDEIAKKLVQQLRDRLRSFLINIAKLYYKAYENKNYLNYETDNLSDGKEFRITDNNSLRATRYTENAVNYMVSNSVSLQICNQCKDQNVKAIEVKEIMDAIISDKENLNDIYRVTNILVCDFIRYNPDKNINSIDFLAHSVKAKPNTKDKYIIELNNKILSWLDENSANYRRRKSRISTAISYKNCILKYIALVVIKANK